MHAALPPERTESWLWATGYQDCMVAIKRRRASRCVVEGCVGILFATPPLLPLPIQTPQAKAGSVIKGGEKNFVLKSLGSPVRIGTRFSSHTHQGRMPPGRALRQRAPYIVPTLRSKAALRRSLNPRNLNPEPEL
jgi:hypothetical protein